MKEFFTNLWTKCIELYTSYSNFIHTYIPRELGDLVEYIIDIIVICILVKIIASFAFGSRSE